MKKQTGLYLSLILLLGSGISMLAVAQEPSQGKPDFGKIEYETKCALCHGTDGKGGGPLANSLTTRVPDLTELAKMNNGIFPIVDMYDAIEGGDNNLPHALREMPRFGSVYRLQIENEQAGVVVDPEAYMRSRILTVIEYINRLQSK